VDLIVQISVIQSDIDNGVRRSRSSCMLALALRRIIKNRLIGVGLESVTFWSEDFRWVQERRLPQEVIEKIYSL